MSITVIKSGICDTIQDKGRTGYAGFGINPSGAMDNLAMQTANALAANDLNTAVIELHFPASSFKFNSNALIAIAGADFGAVITLRDGSQHKLDTNKTALVKAGSILSFAQKKWGERCYLSVHGGFKLTAWFNSHSTNLAIQQGGYKGRRLIKEDTIELSKKLKSQVASTKVFSWLAGIQAWYGDMSTFNILPGPEWDYVDVFSKKHFLSKPFIVTHQSDRMGIRLEGNPIQKSNNEELVSSGVSFGTIQLLPNGQLIILMADHPTTGGYPRIANIISAHLPKLAQAAAGTKIQFGTTEIVKAERSLFSQQQEMHQLQMAVRLQLNGQNGSISL